MNSLYVGTLAVVFTTGVAAGCSSSSGAPAAPGTDGGVKDGTAGSGSGSGSKKDAGHDSAIGSSSGSGSGSSTLAFACGLGSLTCDSATEYCSVLVGPPSSDGGASKTAACQPLPSSCTGTDATCTCLQSQAIGTCAVTGTGITMTGG
jgi:hypothetical protein